MRVIILFFIFLPIVISFSASAEYYKYIDKDGVTHYTDDLSQVPEQNRVKLKKFHELKSEYNKEDRVNVPKVSPEITSEIDNSKVNELKELKRKLDKKFDSIKREREFLVSQGEAISDNNAIEQLNIKAAALNKKIMDYEKQKKEYIKKVKEYNMQLGSKE